MNRFTRRRRRMSVFVGAALVVLAFGVSVGLAASGPSQVKVNLYPRDSLPFCPVKTDKHVKGRATVIREKGVFTVRVHLHDAVPGKYEVVLGVFNPLVGDCVLYGPSHIDTFGVDSSGDGQGSGTFVGMGKQTFAVGVFNQDVEQAYISPFFKLGSS